MLSSDEQELIAAAFPEVQSFTSTSSSADAHAIAVTLENEALKGTATLKFTSSSSSSSSPSTLVLLLSVTFSDGVDALTGSDFDLYLQAHFRELAPSSTEFSELLLQLLGHAAQFDPVGNANPKRASSATRGDGDGDGDDDGDDHDEESDEEEADEEGEDAELGDFSQVEDWAEFSKHQQELKKRRLEQQRQTSTAAALGRRIPSHINEEQFVLLLNMHHIWCCHKKAYILHLAHELQLRGLYLWGRPGRVIVEGPRDEIDFYSRAVRSIRTWKMCKEGGIWKSRDELPPPASQDRGFVFEPSFGFQRAYSEADFKRVFLERQVPQFFTYAFHYQLTMPSQPAVA